MYPEKSSVGIFYKSVDSTYNVCIIGNVGSRLHRASGDQGLEKKNGNDRQHIRNPSSEPYRFYK